MSNVAESPTKKYDYHRHWNPRTQRHTYHYGARLVKRADIPGYILEVLDREDRYSEEEIERNPAKICVVCGVFGKLPRMLNAKPIVLCEEHYYNLTLGKLAQVLREKETAHATSR